MVIPKCLVTQTEKHDKTGLLKKYCLFMHGTRPLRETPLTMLGLLQHLCIIKGRIPSDIINM